MGNSKNRNQKNLRALPKKPKTPANGASIAGRSRFRRLMEPCIMLLLLAVAAVAVFHGYLFFKKVYLFKDIGSDSINIFYPNIVHLVDYLHTWGMPKWTFNEGMGQNLFPTASGDIFIPLFYLVGKNNIAFAIAYVEVLKILIGGFFFYLFLKTLNVTSSAALLGGLLFAFSGYMILGGGWYMFSYDAMCCAILLFAFEKYFAGNIAWILPLPIALLAAYQPFNLYLYGLLLFVYSTARYLEVRRGGFLAYAGFTGRILGLGALGAGISGIFLFEKIAMVLQSSRLEGGAALGGSLLSAPILSLSTPLELCSAVLRLFSNDLQGTGSNFRGWMNYLESPLLYCGLITLLAAPQFFFSLDRRGRKIYLAIAGACIGLSLFPYLRYAFWGFTGNYYRTFSFFISLLLMISAARALSYIDRSSKVNLVALVLSLAIALGLLYVPPYEEYTTVAPNLRFLITVFLLGYAALIALRRVPRWAPVVRVLTLGAVCYEVAILSYLTVNPRPAITAGELSERSGYNDYTVDAVNYLKAIDPGFYRIDKDYGSGPSEYRSMNDSMVQGYYGTSSYSGFNQKYYIRFLESIGVVHPGKKTDTIWAVGLYNRHTPQVLSSVKYVFSKGAAHYHEALWTPIKTFGDVQVFQSNFFLPLGFGYDAYILKSDFDALDVVLRDQAMTKAFVIEDRDQHEYDGFTRLNPATLHRIRTMAEFGYDISLLQASAMQITEHGQSLIRGTVDLKAKKLMFFSVPFDRGWSATVDRKPAEIRLVDFGLTGVLLEPGRHTIELSFHPRFLTLGAIVSALSLACYGILLFFSKRQGPHVAGLNGETVHP